MESLFLGLPFFVWGGITVGVLIVIQILSGLRIIKLSPVWHTKILWKIIVILGLFHFIYGISLYL